ncbi:ribulokinase [Verrucomicrobiota bacterium sgz303538]
MTKLALGLDFGTESVRALLVDLRGNERAVAVVKYRHGQITDILPTSGERLPADFALQHPLDWIDSAAKATRAALRASGEPADSVIGIGVDFTSCTMLPAIADGTPLCQTERWRDEKYAWPKLWKHHGAKSQTDRINAVARQRNEPLLQRYGGTIGLEWFFPKMMETLESAPSAFEAADVWLEAGDWFVWQLVGGAAAELPRSTCQAGYKAMWSREDGFPARDFLRALDPRLEDVVSTKMPGRLLAPGRLAGELTPQMARRFGLRPGTAVSAAIIDAHAGVPGAGAAKPDTLVMVMGTSSCHMLNSTVGRTVPGVAGVVRDGILPGFYGYETGQAATGDAFDWIRRLLGHRKFDTLTARASALAPGADGIRCIDWFNGCRTPLMDGSRRGALSGLTLAHEPEHVFRAVLEASACGLRWIVDTLREGGVPVRSFIATGGLPHSNPLFLQICADVLGEKIAVPAVKQGPALGAAILGAVAAGSEATGFDSIGAAITALTSNTATPPRIVFPQLDATRAYDRVYREYRELATLR